MRIGSLFSGYGGLDLAVAQVLGGRVVWHCEVDPDARRVLRRRWPGLPLYGDVAGVRWADVEPVEVIAGGFPCQDVSGAGRRAGLAPDQSGYLFEQPSNWAAMAAAVAELRPRLVVIENVRGLLRAAASTVDGNRMGSAFGVVLGDLAAIGYDAEWTCVRASDVGGPHRRERVFVAATDARRRSVQRRAEPGGLPGAQGPGAGEGLQRQRRRDTAGDGGPAPADAGGEARPLRAGLRAGGAARLRRGRPDDRGVEAPPDDHGDGREGESPLDGADAGVDLTHGDDPDRRGAVDWGDYRGARRALGGGSSDDALQPPLF